MVGANAQQALAIARALAIFFLALIRAKIEIFC
jgi:hypothetical protein